MIKSGRIIRVGHIDLRDKLRTVVWQRNLKERGHLEDLGANGKIILKRILKEKDKDLDWIVLA